ncbi:MAG: hypothetical protein AWU54_2350, partial [Candidatus Frackibacter sp. T328-2]
MGEVIPIKVLYKYLDFSKEPIKEWNDSTDLLRFLYRLHDKNESIIIDNQVEISANQMSYGKKVYDRGTKRLLDRSKKLKEVAKQNNILFSGGAEDKSEIIKFSEDPIF